MTRNIGLRFIDTVKHTRASLAKLVSVLPREKFHAMRDVFGEDKLDLLFRKGVYPYEHLNSLGRFEELGLPPIEKFVSHLGCGSVGSEEGT